MRIENDTKLDYSDVLIRPKRSSITSRKQVNLYRKMTFSNSHEFNGVPLMASNMDGVGTLEMADELASIDVMTCLVKTYSVEVLTDFYNGQEKRADFVAMTIGTSLNDLDKLNKVMHNTGNKLKYVCVDIANGYSSILPEAVRKIRTMYPLLTIIAGNVVTREMTEELIFSGASIVKIGIGSGNMCLTRVVTGVGYPQLSAVVECADAAHGLGAHVIADGGCVNYGDVAKAFAANADFVMLGTMLAGHDQGGGDIITKYVETDEWDVRERTLPDGQVEKSYLNKIIREEKHVVFYGMSSKSANDKHFGGLKDYRSSEGRTAMIPYKGDVKDTIQQILGGVRSACSYCGASNLKSLPKCTTFIKCNRTHSTAYEKSTIGY